jgi:hypothetical protein
LLAFTVSFQPQLAVRPEGIWLAFVGWAGLGAAILAGVRLHYVWSRFFISFRDYDNRGHKDEGRKVRANLNWWRHLLESLLFYGLVFGVGGVVGFTAINLKNIAVKGEGQASSIANRTSIPPAGPDKPADARPSSPGPQQPASAPAPSR